MQDLNTVSLTCRLTRDPELRHTQGGTAVCNMRVAWTNREKVGGEWTDRSNYIDVTVWGKQGESAAEYLAKGRRIAIDGRLRWREWEANDGSKRQTIEITANSVVFLDYADDDQRPAAGGAPCEHGATSPDSATDAVFRLTISQRAAMRAAALAGSTAPTAGRRHSVLAHDAV